MLLIRFCRDDRIRIHQPCHDLQIKFTRPVERSEFVAYGDGIGELDGRRCLLEWKTSSSRYPEEPERQLSRYAVNHEHVRRPREISHRVKV